MTWCFPLCHGYVRIIVGLGYGTLNTIVTLMSRLPVEPSIICCPSKKCLRSPVQYVITCLLVQCISYSSYTKGIRNGLKPDNSTDPLTCVAQLNRNQEQVLFTKGRKRRAIVSQQYDFLYLCIKSSKFIMFACTGAICHYRYMFKEAH